MTPYYGYTCDPRKPLLPQLRAAVLAFTDRHGALPAAIYLRRPDGVALDYQGGAIPITAAPAIAPDVIGLAVPMLTPTPMAVRYAQESLL
jgi:hypothetical protein